MGKKIITLRELIGAIKDKASQSKAALITSNPNNLSLRLAVLRATTHAPPCPPADHLISALLNLGDGSRATASALIGTVMDRLHRTGDSTVALKTLIIIHNIIKRGPFILQDQLSIFPAAGGRNHLKLSAFRDGANTATWTVSKWVRFYARYLETLLFTSRILGYFVCSTSCTPEKDKQEEMISSFLNSDLIRDVDSLVQLIEEMVKLPDSLILEGNKLLYEIIGLLGNDYLSTVNEILLRLSEFRERLGCLSFCESVELGVVLKRLEESKERLEVLFKVKKLSTESLWSLVGELSKRIEDLKVGKEGPRLLTFGKASESARFGSRVMRFGDSVKFSSGRYGVDMVRTYSQPVFNNSSRYMEKTYRHQVFDDMSSAKSCLQPMFDDQAANIAKTNPTRTCSQPVFGDCVSKFDDALQFSSRRYEINNAKSYSYPILL